MKLRLSHDVEWVEGFFGWYGKAVTVEGLQRSARITVCFICGLNFERHDINVWLSPEEIA